jgi:hypothetical protein
MTTLIAPALRSAATRNASGASSIEYRWVMMVCVISGFPASMEATSSTSRTRAELVIGKAVAIFMPAVALGYLIFGVFFAITQFAANSAVAAAVRNAPQLPAALVFIPLLAAWGVWVGLAISTRVTDVRAAQQLSILGSLPPLALAALMSFQLINPTFGLAAALASGLLAIDSGACFVVARLFDRERLVTGSRPTRSVPAPVSAQVNDRAPADIRSPVVGSQAQQKGD